MPRSNHELAIAMGRRMAARRKELGLTQENVADIAGIAHQQYNKAENGKACLGSDSLQRVSAALQISADYLLNGRINSDKHQELISILDEFSDHQIVLVREVLQCLLHFREEESV